MKILRDDLLDAVDQVGSPLMRAAVAAALDQSGPVLNAQEAGSAIIVAVCSERRFGALGAKPLIGCELAMGGETVWLNADECALHPGLSDWTPGTLAEAFMLPAEVAFTMANLTGSAPVFRSAGVVTAEGLCSGQLAMSFASGALATVFYGQRFTGLHLMTVAHAIAGDGLFAIGERLRQRAASDEAVLLQTERIERVGGVVFH